MAVESGEYLVDRLRKASPETKLVLVGESLDTRVTDALTAGAVHGCLTWGGLNPEGLRGGLMAIIVGDMRICGPGLRGRVDAIEVDLTDLERGVLAGLALGKTEQAISAAVGVRLRTVQTTVARLKSKLRAETLFILGMKARDLGFQVDGGTADFRTVIRAENCG